MTGKITKFVMEDVRCFAGRHELEIRPLTFLVGENSTGKSTALGCFQVLANYFSGELNIGGVDFNPKPYSMGSFADIVSRKSSAGDEFRLGFKTEEKGRKKAAVAYTVQFIKRSQRVEPMANHIEIKFDDGQINFNHKEKMTEESELLVKSTNGKNNVFRVECSLFYPWRYLYFILKFQHTGRGNVSEFLEMKGFQGARFPSPFSFAPIRSRPERTYDSMVGFADPEGKDIPMMIRRMEGLEKNQWEMLKKQLVKFGNDSGLFKDVGVKKLGQFLSEPFQIQVKARGLKTNIMDVGYGVSQILPILIKILSDNYHRIFLMQQPEVHLHPRGQAELASLLAELTKQGKQFVVETHSDYMLDRTRIEIRRGTINPEDVSLVYMEPRGSYVKAHNIGFDKLGNMTGVPRSYRDFFLKESDRLLGFKD